MIRKKVLIREQKARIEELEAQVRILSEKNGELQSQVDAMEERERCIGRAIADASAAADKLVSDAQRQAGEILEQSQEEYDSAKRDAELLVDDAYENARIIVKEAEQNSERKMDDVRRQMEAYAALLNGYDRLIQENIRMAEDSARKYAELSHALHDSVPQLFTSEGKLLDAPSAEITETPKIAETAAESESVETEQLTEATYSAEDETTPSEEEAVSAAQEPVQEHVTEQAEFRTEPTTERKPIPADVDESGEERIYTVDDFLAAESETGCVDNIIDDILSATEEE